MWLLKMVAVCGKYNFLKKLVGMGPCGIKAYRPGIVYGSTNRGHICKL